MSTVVADRASVHPGARLGDGVTVGPGACIGEHVEVGEGTAIGPGAILEGWVKIGRENRIFPHVVIGTEPQDTKFQGERSRVEIGDRNVFREFSTVHRATGEDQVTRIAHDNYFMVASHVAHNCTVGSHTTFVNCGSIGGHCVIEDRVIIAALTAVPQFVRIGTLSMIGGVSKPVKDVPPYLMADGRPLRIRGLNLVGLDRAGVSEATVKALKKVYRLFFRSPLTLEEALKAIETDVEPSAEVRHFLDFVRHPSKLGVYRTTT